jgi:hypothetical protein
LSTKIGHPGDLRRFGYYAEKRKIKYEIADPSETYDLVFLTQSADLSVWSDYQRGNCKVIYDFIDSYGISRQTVSFINHLAFARYLHTHSTQPVLQKKRVLSLKETA